MDLHSLMTGETEKGGICNSMAVKMYEQLVWDAVVGKDIYECRDHAPCSAAAAPSAFWS